MHLQTILPEPVRRWLKPKPEEATPLSFVADNPYFDELQTRARQGEPQAKYELARHFLAAGPKQHMACGLDWLDKAAVGGHAQAFYELAEVYARGLYRPKDDAKALNYCQKAAEAGHAGAIYALGSAFELGRLGVPQSYESARHLYVLAAQSGHAASAYRLGLLHQHGHGVKASLSHAVLWFTIAARQGHSAAKSAKARLSQRLNETQKARILDHLARWYKTAG